MVYVRSLIYYQISFRLSKDFNFFYDNNVDTSKHPLKASSRENDGLKITIKEKHFLRKEEFEPCIKNAWNVHSQFDLPKRESQIEFDYGQSAEILITPRIIRSDPELRKLKLSSRQCYFENERKLKYFNTYSKKFCESECLSFLIFTTCNCTPFHLPRNESMEICNLPGMDCTARFYNVTMEDHNHLFLEHGVCNCLETCNSITYSYEMLETRYATNHSTE
jgi:hypothetical protein